jgi:hypothetical protein
MGTLCEQSSGDALNVQLRQTLDRTQRELSETRFAGAEAADALRRGEQSRRAQTRQVKKLGRQACDLLKQEPPMPLPRPRSDFVSLVFFASC